MKTAKLSIRVVEFQCPECGKYLPNAATGSHMFDVGNGPSELPDTLECDCCGGTFKVPARAKKLT